MNTSACVAVKCWMAFCAIAQRSYGAKLINGTVHTLELPKTESDPYTLHYADHSDQKGLVGNHKSLSRWTW
jgi:hypothetical protein